MKRRVVLGMSGGVDSSVAAWRLVRDGWEVIGVTLKLLPGEVEEICAASPGFRVCCSAEAVEDARAAALRAGIVHHVVDGRDCFRQEVIEVFARAYAAGETPNPCTTCNPRVKLPLLLAVADRLDAPYVATGHYVLRRETRDGVCLYRARDRNKEQSYMLSLLSAGQLARLLLPMGDLTKEEVRAEAGGLELASATRPDSQDICFVPDGDYRAYLRQHHPESLRPGRILSQTGRELGRHEGQALFTIGQRRGLGLAGPRPLYVLRLEANGDVIVGPDADLWTRELTVENPVWQQNLELPAELQVQIRYHGEAEPARVDVLPDGRLRVVFPKPVRAATPGQVAAFYQGELLLGGGLIGRGKAENDGQELV